VAYACSPNYDGRIAFEASQSKQVSKTLSQKNKLGVIVCAIIPATQEEKVGGFWSVASLQGHWSSETLSEK
jgi:hypothetical protein